MKRRFKRQLCGFLLALMCCTSLAVPAFAENEDGVEYPLDAATDTWAEPDAAYTEETAVEEIPVEEAAGTGESWVAEETFVEDTPAEDTTTADSSALTPDGNLTLIDDVGSSTGEGKQFITLQTKDGNIFYLIIDRDSDGNESVYFLNQVDEADLLALMSEEEVEVYQEQEALSAEETSAPTPEENAAAETAAPVAVESASNTGLSQNQAFVALAGAVLLVIGGLIGFIKFLRKKSKTNRTQVPPESSFDYDEDLEEDEP